MADGEQLRNGENGDEVIGTRDGENPGGDTPSSTDVPATTDSQGTPTSEETEDTPKEKISILKSDFAKYLKLTRDGYTLADIIKIFGIDNEIKFGFPLNGEDDFIYTEKDTPEDGLANCYDNDEDSKLSKEQRDKFFEGCECTGFNNQVNFSDEASEGHNVINCEEEIKDGVTFFDFMNVKAEKFFGEPKANENAETDKEKAIEELKKKYFNGNNDEWKLNPEEAEVLENGGHQFYFNEAESAEGTDDGEVNIPRDLETYKDWAKILDDTDEMDDDAYAQWLVARMKKIFEEQVPDYEPDDEEKLVNFYAVINKLFLDFFSGLEDDEDMKEALGAFRYYNAVAQGEINNEQDIYFTKYESMKEAVDAINEALKAFGTSGELDRDALKENIKTMEEGVWYFLNNFVAVEVEAMRALHENPEFDEDTSSADTVRKMILEYARKDGLKSENDPADYSFNKFLHYGFGKFLSENAENAPSDEEAKTLVDLSFLYQFKDAMLRKAALKKLADSEDDLATGVDKIALMEDSEGSDEEPATNKYMPDPEKFWTPEYKVTNLEDGLIPTKDVDVEDLTPNWIDPAGSVETDDEGKSSITETVGNAVWEPFTTDEGLLGGAEVLKRTVMTNEAEAPIDEIENLVKSEETSGSGEGGTDGNEGTDGGEGNNEGGSSDDNEGGTDGGEGNNEGGTEGGTSGTPDTISTIKSYLTINGAKNEVTNITVTNGKVTDILIEPPYYGLFSMIGFEDDDPLGTDPDTGEFITLDYTLSEDGNNMVLAATNVDNYTETYTPEGKVIVSYNGTTYGE